MVLLHVPRNNYTCFISNAKIYRVTTWRQDLRRRARRQDLWRRGLVHVGARSPPSPMPRQDLGAKSHGAEARIHERKSNHLWSICEHLKKTKNKKSGRKWQLTDKVVARQIKLKLNHRCSYVLLTSRLWMQRTICIHEMTRSMSVRVE